MRLARAVALAVAGTSAVGASALAVAHQYSPGFRRSVDFWTCVLPFVVRSRTWSMGCCPRVCYAVSAPCPTERGGCVFVACECRSAPHHPLLGQHSQHLSQQIWDQSRLQLWPLLAAAAVVSCQCGRVCGGHQCFWRHVSVWGIPRIQPPTLPPPSPPSPTPSTSNNTHTHTQTYPPRPHIGPLISCTTLTQKLHPLRPLRPLHVRGFTSHPPRRLSTASSSCGRSMSMTAMLPSLSVK